MKVFASDYDGTIKIDHAVSERNLLALTKWKKDGNVFGIVTGRSVESILQEKEQYDYDLDFLICNNGGVIYDHNMQLLKSFEIDFDKALTLIEEIRTMDCNCFVLNNGINRAKEIVNNEYEDYKYGSYSSEYTVDKIINEKRICQIVISLNDNELGKKISEHINQKYAGYVEAYPNINCVDIVPSGISKASGIAYIAEQYGYLDKHIYTMGDAFNDIPMLEAYQSATLHDTFEEVKQCADDIVEDVAQYLMQLEKKGC